MAEINKPTNINIIWAASGIKSQPSDAKYLTGFVVEIPNYENANYIINKAEVTLAHINQHGLPEWDSETEYQANKSYTLGSDGKIYFCLTTNIGVDPTTDVSEIKWRAVMDGRAPLYRDETTSYSRLILNQSTSSTALDVLGATTVGKSLLKASSAASARSTLGATTVGSNVFTAASQSAARSAIGIVDADESNKGIAQKASTSDITSGTDDSKFTTISKLRAGFGINKSANGYITFPTWLGGLIIRWGSVNVGSNASTTITGLFPTSCLQAIVGLGVFGSTFDNQYPPFCTPAGAGLTVINPDNEDTSLIRYIAIGY